MNREWACGCPHQLLTNMGWSPALRPSRSSSSPLLLWPPFPVSVTNRKSHHLLPSSCGVVGPPKSNSPFLRLHRSPNFAPPTPPRFRFCRRLAAGASSPPPGEDPQDITGIKATLSRIPDKLQIFFAVLFWMSLFFWGCACERGNDSRKKKGPWFRK